MSKKMKRILIVPEFSPGYGDCHILFGSCLCKGRQGDRTFRRLVFSYLWDHRCFGTINSETVEKPFSIVNRRFSGVS